MPVANPTTTSQRELVRLLVIEHGQKRASELSNVPYETVRKWTQRGKWDHPSRHSDCQSVIVPNVPISPKAIVDNVANEIAQNGTQTRLNLSRTHRKHSEGKLTPKDAKLVAEAARITHDWGENKAEAGFTLNVLNLNAFGIEIKGE